MLPPPSHTHSYKRIIPIPETAATHTMSATGNNPVSTAACRLNPAAPLLAEPEAPLPLPLLPLLPPLPEPPLPLGTLVTVPVPAVPACDTSEAHAPLALDGDFVCAAPLKAQAEAPLDCAT